MRRPPGTARVASLWSPSPLSLSTRQHELLRDCLALGLEGSGERLAGTAAASTGIHLESVTSCVLADLDPERAARGISGDLIAGVLQRFEGRLSGTALLALEPGDALLWLQRGEDEGEPLARFVDWGQRLLGGVVDSLATVLRADVTPGEPRLEERALMAALLGTHAPSDTVVLSLHGELAFPVSDLPELRAPFSIQVLLAPKLVGGILGGLAGDRASP